MGKLTVKQIKVLDVIKKYIAKYGYSPSIREICKEINLSSSASAYKYVNVLESKGYIKKDENKKIKLLVPNEYENNFTEIFFLDSSMSLKFPKDMIDDNNLVLFKSICNFENILKGDILIIKRYAKVNENDLVLLDDFSISHYKNKDNFIGKVIMLYRKI